MLIHFRNSKSNDMKAHSNYFLGRKRLTQALSQGRFKHRISLSEVYVGSLFTKHALALSAGTVQTMSTYPPGEEPNMTLPVINENFIRPWTEHRRHQQTSEGTWESQESRISRFTRMIMSWIMARWYNAHFFV